jgi:hypothetical protein
MVGGEGLELVLVLMVFGFVTVGVVGLCLNYGRDD